MQLTYRKPGQRETELRVVDPYHLANINGEWFLFAWCHLRKDIRTFVPARIQAIEPTGKTFARPQKFSLEKRLRDSFGVQSGQGSFDVVIRFNELVADYIREKKWHDSQELQRAEGRRSGTAHETLEPGRSGAMGLGLGRQRPCSSTAPVSRQRCGGRAKNSENCLCAVNYGCRIIVPALVFVRK